MGRFVISVRELDEGTSEHHFDIPVEWLSSTLEGCEGLAAGDEPGTVDLTATKRGREVLIRGTVRGMLQVTCVRCLEKFAQQIEANVDVLMIPAAARNPGKDEDDLGVERYRGDLITLDELIRDELILEVPMNPNCGDECLGWDHLRSDPSEAS